MVILRANILHQKGIQLLENELNMYRSTIFEKANIDFHAKIQAHSLTTDKDIDTDICFILKNDSDKIVGFIQGSIHQRKNHSLHTLGSIDKLYIKDEYRKRGFAKKLFSELENEFRKQGCDHITVHTDAENQLSQEFYQHMNMSKTTVEFWKAI